jgi:hypothetical protein
VSLYLRAIALTDAFSLLSSTPNFKGAVILLLSEDAVSVSVKSNMPSHLVQALLRDVLEKMSGEKSNGSIIIH